MLTTKTSGGIITTLTQSWRYLLFLSLLPYFAEFIFFCLKIHNNIALFIASLLFLFTQYSLFRLWLDSRFFQIFYRYNETESFDESLTILFPSRPQHTTQQARWLGTKRLFTLALWGVALQWGLFVFALLS